MAQVRGRAVETRDTHRLNVLFELPLVEVRDPQSSEERWVFEFLDCAIGTPISILKRELREEYEDYLLVVVLYEPDTEGRHYFPHRFTVHVRERPAHVVTENFRAALITALHRIMGEMEVRLKQSHFEGPLPALSYGRVLTSSGKEVVLTHRSRFLTQSTPTP